MASVASSRDKIVELFKHLDKDGDGSISPQELAGVLQVVDAGGSWPEARLDVLLKEADANLDGRIQYEEFIAWLFRDDTAGLQRAFCATVERALHAAGPGAPAPCSAPAPLPRDAAASALAAADALGALASMGPREAEVTLEALRRVLVGTEEGRRRVGRSLLASGPLSVGGCADLLRAAGFVEEAGAGGERLGGIELPAGVDVRWVIDSLDSLLKSLAAMPRPTVAPAPPSTPPTTQRPGSRREDVTVVTPVRPRCTRFGPAICGAALEELVERLRELPPMDKHTMSGRCATQTIQMEDFMGLHVGMRQLPDKYFVKGVRAFTLEEEIAKLPRERELVFRSADADSGVFRMSVAEVLEWQSSFRAFYAADVYEGEEGVELILRSLRGKSQAGDEAFAMKFLVRCSVNPVLMRFDGKIINRVAGDKRAGLIYLVSVCGIDFAARVHDYMDIVTYVSNYEEVYVFQADSLPQIVGGRDFVPTSVKASLRMSTLFRDLKRMARLRLLAQDRLGIRVVVEVGVGLGVFAGDAVGIGDTVRHVSALALKRVLEEERFANIELVVLSLPLFDRSLDTNFEIFTSVFQRAKEPYAGKLPVLIMDQDMHAIALAAAEAGYTVGELNPADSHGVFGEYWQNFGPGTEEKLALTTCGLLTQHHAVNPRVLDPTSYTAVEMSDDPA